MRIVRLDQAVGHEQVIGREFEDRLRRRSAVPRRWYISSDRPIGGQSLRALGPIRVTEPR